MRSTHKTLKNRERVWLADKGVCWLCCAEVPYPQRQVLTQHDHWEATIDHVIPVSLQGTNDLNNARLAHRWCNNYRGQREVTGAVREDIQTARLLKLQNLARIQNEIRRKQLL